jgi:hypothetical protein
MRPCSPQSSHISTSEECENRKVLFMAIDHTTAAAVAGRYFNTDKPLKSLGWGVSGFVYLSPSLRSAVKVHRHNEQFSRELEVYQRLLFLKIYGLHGLTIPKLRGFNEEAMAIEMDFVSAPYLLDFAGCIFDAPDFSEDAMDQWHANIERYFRPNTSVVYDVYNSLVGYGIYYMDFRPSNLKLDGLPGLVVAIPDPDADDDEF